MFTPGSAGGRSVLVWEGPAALKEAGAQVGADRWCDKVGPVVVSYHTGKSSSGLPGEMTRQLDGQFTALSLMSAKEILAGMTTFDERKRSPASHTRIRKDFQKELTENLWKRHKFPKDVAGLWASRAMRELAVLHNPDQLLSGPQGPSLVGGVVALGDRVTNSAVGSQTAQGPRELIRAAAQAAVDAGQGDRLLRMRVVLTDSPDLSRGLNRGLEALEPRSLAEREAVSPRGPPLTVQVLSDRMAQVPGGPGSLEDLTRDELRQALTQPPAQTPDHPDTPTPDRLGTGTPDGLDHAPGLGDEPLPGDRAPEMGTPETGAPGLDTAGLDEAGLDGGAPEMGAPSTGSPAMQALASAPVAGQPVPGPAEQVARPTDSSPSMSAPTPDLNAPDRAAPDRSSPERNAPDRAVPEASAPEQTRPDKATPGAGAPDAGVPGRTAPDAGAPDGGAPERSAPDAGVPGTPGRGAPDGGAPGGPAQVQVPGVGRSAPPSVPPVSAEPPVAPARSQRVASPTPPKQPFQPGQPGRPAQQNQPGQPGRPARSEQPGRQNQPGQPGQSGRSAQPGQVVQSGGSGLSGRGAAGVGASGANAWLEASSRLQASQGTGTLPALARSGPFTPAGPAQPAPQRSTTGPTAGETPSRSTGDAPSRSAGGRTTRDTPSRSAGDAPSRSTGDAPSRGAGRRGTDTTSRTTPRSTSRSASRSTSRSAGATASRARTAAQDPIKAFLAPTGDPQRDAVLAGISSKLDKLRQQNQQRQPTQAPTRTTPSHHPRR